MALFDAYIGIDYSGAKTPTDRLPGLRVYAAARDEEPVEVRPHWSRREVAEFLLQHLNGDKRVLVGIDHGFSFPLKYFDRHQVPRHWPVFLEDFYRHWPTDGTSVELLRNGSGAARGGETRWRRLTEVRAGGAKSVFHFDVPGSVAKSTHAGLPWLLYLRKHAGARAHFWPFDGFAIPPGKSVLAEVYPALWSANFAKENRTGDQHDAYSVAAWLRAADANGTLPSCFDARLNADERKIALVEGWILGV